MLMKNKTMTRTTSQAGLFWVRPLLLVVFLSVFPHLSLNAQEADPTEETETTSNVLSNPGFESNTNTGSPTNWTVEDGQVFICDRCGPFGGNALTTGNEGTHGGGTVSQTIDLLDQMSLDQLNHGVEIDYSSQVHSDLSNATVPLCSATTGDCKDSLSINVTINDSNGNLLHQFTNEFNDITFTGWDTTRTTFSFTNTIPENTHTSALLTLELFGSDLGFSGNSFGGPRFDNVQLTLEFATTAALDAIAAAELAAQQAADIATSGTSDSINTTPVQVEVVVTDNSGSELVSEIVEVASVSAVVAPPQAPAAPVAPVVAAPAASSQTQEAVADVEAEVQAEVAEATTEPEPQESASNESESESENTETAEVEKDGGNDRDSNSKSSGDKKSSKNKKNSKSKGKTALSKEELKKEIKRKIVTRIIQKLGNDAASQATQLALMNIIGADITSLQPTLIDASTWYTSDSIYANQQQITDPFAGAYNSAQDSIMNNMINSQY
jgi:hypothetical protein